MDALNKKISSILDEISNEIMCDAASGDMTCPASQTGGGLLSSCFRSSNKIYDFSQIQFNTPIDDCLEAHNLKIQILDLQAKEFHFYMNF